ncbi:hypothetical protein PS918_03098 [Pseudomonas fluorescens]|uniref:Uncharacterized protein n=1 Tax=Pseudomonas fluorescens TaxID=294 RepID=A0A5E7ST39_PSEFL|nr:hypothetical protein [Pseudomonas fluorescens]VVP89566.1 hypothetical protein PS918_03098 [Pseudomonas fluorescens]
MHLGDRVHWENSRSSFMYLMIFEDGEIKSAQELSEDDVRAADDGCLDIIDISEPHTPTRRFSDGWVLIESIED